LFIPADFDQQVSLVEIDSHEQLRALLGGSAERAVYDRDAEVWVNGTGLSDGLAHNLGASAYVAISSGAARQRGGAIDVDLHGDVIMTGPDETDVPERLIKEFAVTERHTVDELLGRDRRKGFGPEPR